MKKQRQQRDMNRILRLPQIKNTVNGVLNFIEKAANPPDDYMGSPITDKISRFIDDFVKQLQDELDFVTKGKNTPQVTRVKDLIRIMYHSKYGNHPFFLKFEKSKFGDNFCCIRSSWAWEFKPYAKGMHYNESVMEINLADYDYDEYIALNIRDCVICHFSDVNGFGIRKINTLLAKGHGWLGGL